MGSYHMLEALVPNFKTNFDTEEKLTKYANEVVLSLQYPHHIYNCLFIHRCARPGAVIAETFTTLA
jgi:hypothetical protein